MYTETKARKWLTAELGEYLGQIKSYAEALQLMDVEQDTLFVNCMDLIARKDYNMKIRVI